MKSLIISETLHTIGAILFSFVALTLVALFFKADAHPPQSSNPSNESQP